MVATMDYQFYLVLSVLLALHWVQLLVNISLFVGRSKDVSLKIIRDTIK